MAASSGNPLPGSGASIPSEIEWTTLPPFVHPPTSAPYESTFRPVTALWLISAACLSYESAEICARVVRDVWGCTRFRFFEDKATDTQAIAFANDELVIVAFRGTESLKDGQTDATFLTEKFFERAADVPTTIEGGKGFPFDKIEVHRGFNKAAKGVLSDIEEWLLSSDGGDLKSKSNANATRSFYITGHSLGGALAAITYARFTLRNTPLQPNGVMTIGQPRCGNDTFVDALNRFGRCVLQRLVNENDIVPTVPPPIHSYQHYGKLVFFDRYGYVNRWPEELGFDKAGRRFWGKSIKYHKSALYLDRVQQHHRRVVEQRGSLPIYRVELQVHSGDDLARIGHGVGQYYCQLQTPTDSLFTATARPSSSSSSSVTWNEMLAVPALTMHDIITLKVFGKRSATDSPGAFMGQLELALDAVDSFDKRTYQLWGAVDASLASSPPTVTISARFLLLKGIPEQAYLKGKLIVHGATGLKGDSNTDPYVIIENSLVNTTTQVAKGTTSPDWQQECPLDLVHSGDTLHITVMDKRAFKDGELGTVSVLLESAGSSIAKKQILLLPTDRRNDKDIRGAVIVSLLTEPVAQASLIITVHKAADLMASDPDGLSDPFVQITVPGFASERELTFKTKTIKKTLNPTWEESFVAAVVTPDTKITLTVTDEDILFNDFLGQVVLQFPAMQDIVQKVFPLRGRSSTESQKITGHVVLSFKFTPTSGSRTVARL